MRPSRIRRSIAVLGLLALAACARDDPTAPGVHSLTGHVRLTGYHIDLNGQPAGTRVIGDADGVPIELLYGSQVVASTTTSNGSYTFSGLAPGGYRTRSRVLEEVDDQTVVLTIANADLVALDTLGLASIGNIYPVPNPFVNEAMVYFELPDSQQVAVTIQDVAGNPIRTVLNAVRPAGMNQARWDGLDQDGLRANGPIYWVTVETIGSFRAHLLFH